MSTTKQQPSGGATLAQQGHSCYCPNCEALSKELAELQAQKPIAWRVKWPAIGGGYKWMLVDSPLMEKEGFVNEALYGKAQALAEQPAQQQEPVAWIEHEWSGSGLKHLHFDRREPSVRDEVMNPVWTPLYTSPQPAQQEPVVRWDSDGWGDLLVDSLPDGTLLYTSPPAQRTWVGLTHEEFRDFATTYEYGTGGLIRAIEAKLKAKNSL